jgi:acetoin utilization deacetylase AcuC-like enzyme
LADPRAPVRADLAPIPLCNSAHDRLQSVKLFYADQFVLPLPAEHRFPMAKYVRLRERLARSGAFGAEDFYVPDAADDEAIRRAHCPDYLRRVTEGLLVERELRRIGFPWSRELVERSRRSAGATLAACRAALAEGCAANLAGGTHHAHRDFGAGFCVFNDAAIAARAMQAEGRAGRVLIIDCDVHQGDGTAAILAGDPDTFAFSIHGARNFPFRKAVSDLDVELPDGTGDAEYLRALEAALEEIFARFDARLAIYLAGADPYENDRYGRLKLTMAGLAARDELVLSACRARGLPVAMAMAGGYGREIDDTVRIHTQTVLTARALLG